MIPAKKPENEDVRLAKLKELDVLDTAFEKAYDDLTKLAGLICDTPISLVSLVDGDRQWFKSRQGLEATETARDISFCGHAIHQESVFEVENAKKDERFADNPLVTGGPEISFYAGYPIEIEDNIKVGTLCVIDKKPKKLTDQQKEALGCLGRQVASLLKLRKSTQKMREISDNVRVGLLTITAEGKVQGGFSQSCHVIFGEAFKEGDRLSDWLMLDENGKLNFELNIEQVFADFMPEAVAISQVPKRFTLQGREYTAEVSVIRDKDAAVKSVLFTVTDSTELYQAKRELLNSQSLLKVASERNQFKIFLNDYKTDTDKARAALKKNDEKMYRSILHTLKGNFLSFGIYTVGELIHSIESKSSPQISDLDAINSKLTEFLDQLEQAFGIGFKLDQPSFFQVREDYVEKLESFIARQNISGEGSRFLSSWLEEIRTYPVGDLISHMIKGAYRSAARLDKRVDIKIKNGSLPVNPKLVNPVLKNFVHLLNNSIDHGLEKSHERGSKSETGTIELDFNYDDPSGCFVFKVSDDGQGIDPDKVKQSAIKKGLITEEAAKRMSVDDLLNLIFEPGFSTSQELSEISGRGVGMTALKETILGQGGTIEVQSIVGKGTTFTMRFPVAGASASRTRQVA